MGALVRAEERLFSLVLALLATQVGLTKQQIFATVRGYEPDSNNGAQLEALERKFERDKNDLRDLGIPLETVDSPEAPGDNQLFRYRIPRDEYVFPRDISFTSAELALLNVAGEVWREGTVSALSHRALTKLRSFDMEPDAPVLGYVPRLRTREIVFDSLNRAIDSNQRVAFEYLKPGEPQPARRDVTPFALGIVEGRWHLLGYDHTRQAERTFLLSRIHSNIVNAPGDAANRPQNAPERLVEGLRELETRNRAQVRVRRRSVSAAELTNRPRALVSEAHAGWIAIDLPFLDEVVLAEELAGCGPEVQVDAPDSLRERVLELLRLARDAHGGAA